MLEALFWSKIQIMYGSETANCQRRGYEINYPEIVIDAGRTAIFNVKIVKVDPNVHVVRYSHHPCVV